MEKLEVSCRKPGRYHKWRIYPKAADALCGPNNSGKTWAMYSLYYCHYRMAVSRSAEQKEPPSLKEFNQKLSEGLSDLFITEPALLKNAKFCLDDFGESEELLSQNVKRPFLIPAERKGLHLFFRELGTRRTALLHHGLKAKYRPIRIILKDVMRSRYALPIAHTSTGSINCPKCSA